MDEHLMPELEGLKKHMPEGNDLDTIVLKGHLLIEEGLIRTIRTIIAHGDMLERVRLTFAQTAAIAQAMCWGRHGDETWDVIVALNVLRNSIAHQLESPKLRANVQRLLDAFDKAVNDSEYKAQRGSVSEPEKIKDAIAFVLGFLGSYEGDAKGYRQLVDEAYKEANSNSD
jgi:hypothetical protein